MLYKEINLQRTTNKDKHFGKLLTSFKMLRIVWTYLKWKKTYNIIFIISLWIFYFNGKNDWGLSRKWIDKKLFLTYQWIYRIDFSQRIISEFIQHGKFEYEKGISLNFIPQLLNLGYLISEIYLAVGERQLYWPLKWLPVVEKYMPILALKESAIQLEKCGLCTFCWLCWNCALVIVNY